MFLITQAKKFVFPALFLRQNDFCGGNEIAK
jgi:hypothetical protein